jgi:hypothetical protein
MLDIKNIHLQPLCVPTGWKIIKNIFFDVEPILNEDGELPKEKSIPYFEAELLYAEHEKSKWIINMGWTPEDDPDGEFRLDIIKESFSLNDPIAICQTKDKNKIVEAVNQTMLKISQESGDTPLDCPALKEFIIRGVWKVTHNSFYNTKEVLDLEKQTSPRPAMLRLETGSPTKYIINLSWQPTSEPKGCYTVSIFQPHAPTNILYKLETSNINEIPSIIDKLSRWQTHRPKQKTINPQHNIKV